MSEERTTKDRQVAERKAAEQKRDVTPRQQSKPDVKALSPEDVKQDALVEDRFEATDN